jgi:hypothetical protein
LSGAFDEKGRVKLSERVKAIPPWPIVGYDMPRIRRGEVVTRIFEINIFGFIFSLKRKRWEEKRMEGL